MTGAAKAEYDEIAAFCEDFTEDLKKISVPVLVTHHAGGRRQRRPAGLHPVLTSGTWASG
ncbi:hypothetical protein OHA10_08315 [Kribbella sp. NBC_00662]|uniref:hypothetical protein n=1 Tax=Kribbella sp. NBC_00662 TaxID=2975969 RepID=UPI003246DDAD